MTPLDVSLDSGNGKSKTVGRLAERDRRIFFEFAASFLANPLPLSPFHLEPRLGVTEGRREPFEGLHGLFADSMPDAWGRLLIDRALRRDGHNPATLTPLDRLAMIGEGGAGALVYKPAHKVEPDGSAVNLNNLALDAKAVLQDDVDPVALDRLRTLGGSSGGARPKALLHRDPATDALYGVPAVTREPWIVKFRSTNDPADIGAIEFAYAELARHAGLQVAETRLFPMKRGAGYFGTRRFDRFMIDGKWSGRFHMHSLAGLLQADYRMPSVGYDSLIKATRLLTKNEIEAEAAFRLMVFNVATHNRDDHAKNVAFLMDEVGDWRFAPAFDLTFSDGPGGEHSMDVLGEGRSVTRAHVLRLAKETGIRNRVATDIIEEVCEALADAKTVLSRVGVTAHRAKNLCLLIERQRKELG